MISNELLGWVCNLLKGVCITLILQAGSVILLGFWEVYESAMLS